MSLHESSSDRSRKYCLLLRSAAGKQEKRAGHLLLLNENFSEGSRQPAPLARLPSIESAALHSLATDAWLPAAAPRRSLTGCTWTYARRRSSAVAQRSTSFAHPDWHTFAPIESLISRCVVSFEFLPYCKGLVELAVFCNRCIIAGTSQKLAK